MRSSPVLLGLEPPQLVAQPPTVCGSETFGFSNLPVLDLVWANHVVLDAPDVHAVRAVARFLKAAWSRVASGSWNQSWNQRYGAVSSQRMWRASIRLDY